MMISNFVITDYSKCKPRPPCSIKKMSEMGLSTSIPLPAPSLHSKIVVGNGTCVIAVKQPVGGVALIPHVRHAEKERQSRL